MKKVISILIFIALTTIPSLGYSLGFTLFAGVAGVEWLARSLNTMEDDGVHVRMKIRFNTESYTIANNSKRLLNNFGSVLSEFKDDNDDKVLVEIVGHTDSIGTPEHNLILSRNRAKAVANYLIVNYGFSKKNLRPIGKGESQPIDTNMYKDGRRNNRRVEISIYHYKTVTIDMEEPDTLGGKISKLFGFD